MNRFLTTLLFVASLAIFSPSLASADCGGCGGGGEDPGHEQHCQKHCKDSKDKKACEKKCKDEHEKKKPKKS